MLLPILRDSRLHGSFDLLINTRWRHQLIEVNWIQQQPRWSLIDDWRWFFVCFGSIIQSGNGGEAEWWLEMLKIWNLHTTVFIHYKSIVYVSHLNSNYIKDFTLEISVPSCIDQLLYFVEYSWKCIVASMSFDWFHSIRVEYCQGDVEMTLASISWFHFDHQSPLNGSQLIWYLIFILISFW